jgi:penicillin amidase
MRRVLLKAAAAVVLLVAVVALGGYLYLRRSLPQIDGTITVGGVSGPVDIIRDADAVPHIFAANKADGLFGLGYVHAQDRLWQMELQRRIGYGRLSEVLGAAALPQDRFLRTVGFGRAAKTAWAATPEWAKQQVTAYVAGVNAFISTHHGGTLPPEFTLLRFEPEPWSGADVIVWVKMMAWDLSANYSFELLRHDLANAVGPERMAQLMPPYAADGLSIVPDASTESGGAGAADTVARRREPSVASTYPTYLTHPPFPTVVAFTRGLSEGDPTCDLLLGGAASEGLGSNNWVVDGTMTVSGKPMLANDPHLSARLPSTWYLAHVSAGDFEVIGATLPGSPAVALGRNRFIAWGATNVAADVEDLYRERLDASGTHAEFRGVQEPITVIPETILVKGGAAVRVDVRVTRHGPLVSDAINANNAASKIGPKPPPLEPLAFRWTALDADDLTVPSFMKLNEARNWTEFTGALRDFVAPSQNFVYGDVEGHIGYYAPGRVPVRASGDGAQPADGWTGGAEWTGWIPFEELPHLYDPPEHLIVTANHRPEPPSYPHHLGLEWPEPYRAQRINDLLRGNTRLTPDDFARIQADTISLHATTLLPILLAHAHPDGGPQQQAVTMLQQWNKDAAADSGAAAIFSAWFQHLAPTLARRRSRAAALGPLRGALLVRDAVRHRDAGPQRQRMVRQPDDRRPRDVRRRGDGRAADGGRRSDRSTRQRHVALALGRRASGPVPASGPGRGRGAASDPQPLGAERRRLEHGGRGAGGRRSALRADPGPRLPRDHRSLSGQRQPLPRRRRAVRALPVRPLRRCPARLARGPSPEDADGARADRTGRARQAPARSIRTVLVLGFKVLECLVLASAAAASFVERDERDAQLVRQPDRRHRMRSGRCRRRGRGRRAIDLVQRDRHPQHVAERGDERLRLEGARRQRQRRIGHLELKSDGAHSCSVEEGRGSGRPPSPKVSRHRGRVNDEHGFRQRPAAAGAGAQHPLDPPGSAVAHPPDIVGRAPGAFEALGLRPVVQRGHRHRPPASLRGIAFDHRQQLPLQRAAIGLRARAQPFDDRVGDVLDGQGHGHWFHYRAVPDP